MSFLIAILTLWATLWIAGDTPVGRLLHRCAVAAPARWLNGLARGTVVALVLLVAIGGIASWALGSEGMAMFGMAMPELAGMLIALDVATLVEVATTAVVASTGLRLRAVVARLPGGRRRRVPSRPAILDAANDDGDHRPAIAA